MTRASFLRRSPLLLLAVALVALAVFFAPGAQPVSANHKLSTPTGFSAAVWSATSVTVQWTLAGTPNTQDFSLEYRLQGETGFNTVALFSRSGTVTETVTGLTRGATYEFRVQATAAGHTASDWTNWVAVTLPTPNTCSGACFVLNPAESLAYEGGNATLDIYTTTGATTRTVTITTNVGSGATASAADLGTVPTSATINTFFGSDFLRDAVTIPIATDTSDEESESFTVTVSVPGFSPLYSGADTVTVTIPETRFILHDAYVFEGQTAVVEVILTSTAPSGGLAFDVTARTSTDDTSLTATTSDFGTVPSTFTIPEGAKKGTLSIPITNDSSQEESEKFEVQLITSKAGWSAVNGKFRSTVIISSSDCPTCQQGPALGSISLYGDLIANVKEWRNDARYVSDKAHTDRWDRVLLALGEEVSDATLEPMTASEAQGYADRGWTRWVEVAEALRELEAARQQQPETPDDPPQTTNQAPTVDSPIADITIVNAGGSQQVSLSDVFSDADNDALTITAASSSESVATVAVASGGSSLTVTARSGGPATITVTAEDGNGGTVSDAFEVWVKSAPTVFSAPVDITGLLAGSTQEVSLRGVFSEPDGDPLKITASSSDDAVASVLMFFDGTRLTVTGESGGDATITVVAQDTDGNQVATSFDVSVLAARRVLLTPPQDKEVDDGDPAPVLNLRCIAETGRVAFLWDAPTWSGANPYAYDYRLTLPSGRSETGRLIGGAVVYRPGNYQQGDEASMSVKAVYELPDDTEVSSAAELTCTIGG